MDLACSTAARVLQPAPNSCVHVNGQALGYLNEAIESTFFCVRLNPRFSERDSGSLVAFRCGAGRPTDRPRFDHRRADLNHAKAALLDLNQ